MFAELGDFVTRLFHTIRLILIHDIFGSIILVRDVLPKKLVQLEFKDKSNEVAIVTGGSLGMGKQTVQMLLECNMDVVIGCPEIQEGEAAIRSIREAGITKGKVSVIELDYRNFKSVQKFASTFYERYKYLNLLVNNAGIINTRYEETEDGYESHFAVNYLGSFLLTHLLLPAMTKASTQFRSNPRIINVSSTAHVSSPPINYSLINSKQSFNYYKAYSQSKLSLLMFTKILNRKFKTAASTIQAIAVHPGLVNTDMLRNWRSVYLPWLSIIVKSLLKIITRTPKQGAQTIVFCCIDDATENAGGLYYTNCKPTKCMYTADIVQDQEKLYQYSINAVENFLPANKKKLFD